MLNIALSEKTMANAQAKNGAAPLSLLENIDVDNLVSWRYSLGMDESAYEKENRPLSLSLGMKTKAKASDRPRSENS